MSSDKKESDPEKLDNWNFKLELQESEKTVIKTNKVPVSNKNKKLILDIDPVEVVPELKKISSNKKDNRSVNIKEYEPAGITKRVLAQLIDLVVILITFFMSAFFVPFVAQFCQALIDRTNFSFLTGKIVNTQYVHFAIFILDYFILYVVFLAFSNSSVGKKIMGLSVRGKNYYNLSITQAFSREMIFKPISFLSVIGILISFFNEDKKALHDLLATTIVIKNK